MSRVALRLEALAHMGTRGRSMVGGWLLWVAIPLYLLPLLAAPLLMRGNDVVAQADTASYLHLVDDFSLVRRYGDHWAPKRTTPVVAQEHKVKHILYVLGASTVVRAGKPLGLSTMVATQLFNAIVAALALALFMRALPLYHVPPALAMPLTLLYAAAPGQWIYAGIPESWPLSGLLTVCLLFVAVRWPGASVRLGLLAGIAMLNNPLLGSGALLAGAAPLEERRLVVRVRDAAVASTVALLVWIGLLWLLSRFDPAFRPDHYLTFLRWFRTAVSEESLLTLWFMRHSLLNAFVLPFASSTPNHDLAYTAVADSWKASWLGRVAISAVFALWVAVAGMTLRQLRARATAVRLFVVAAGPLALLLVLGVGYYVGSPVSMLLYSSTLIPLVLLLMGTVLTGARWAPLLLWAVWLVCLPATVQQLHWYRRIANAKTLPAFVVDDPAWPSGS